MSLAPRNPRPKASRGPSYRLDTLRHAGPWVLNASHNRAQRLTVRSSYPTSWNHSSQMPMSHIPASGPSYPSATMATEPYQKMPMSGTQNFTAEPQDMPLQTSMPSVQLSLAAQDQQQPPIRTQYATYVQSTSAPPQMSLSATADSSLSVPRYMDDGQRPSKSPRHAGHQSVHSTSSITNDSPSNEYRYGPPYVGVNSAPADISNQSHQSSTFAPAGQDHGSAPSSAATTAPPPRDYFPPSQSWTTTAGESSASNVSYTNGDHRPYAFPEQYKTGHSGAAKPDSHLPAPPHSAPGVYQGQPLNHYAWSAT